MSSATRRPRIVVVGSVMVDLITYADPLPGMGETVIGHAFEIGCGGKGANQAVISTRLGAEVSFVGRVGSDSFGEMSLESLRAQGLATSRVGVVEGASTGVAPIWVAGDGSNRIIVVPGANDTLDAVAVRAELVGHPRADTVVCQLEIPDQAVIEAFAIGGELGALRILNPAPARAGAERLFHLADWVVPNESEFEAFWGAPPSDENVRLAGEKWGCNLVVTLGVDGVVATIDGEIVRVPTFPAQVVDTTGAGDAFVGGFAVGLALGLPTGVAVELGNLCGSMSTETRGTQSSFPTREVIEQRWGRSVSASAQAAP